MRQGKPTYYWDACLFLAWLKDEQREAGDMEGLAEVIWMVDRNRVTISTSVVTKGEIWQSTLTEQAKGMFTQMLKRRNVVLVNLTDPISELSATIRQFYVGRKEQMDLPDAQHLATAIAYKTDEFHTFDDKLLNKSGNVAGYRLIICKPKGLQGILFV
jgi:predicted nucleic acid-binding protein